jgi:putative ABC transport system ATP-binding protein
VDDNNQHQPVIDLHHVTKTYRSGTVETTVLHDINLQVLSGEFVSIMGPSGSGKSTLVNMITGIDRPTSGEVFVAGQRVNGLGEDQLARWRGQRIGVIFQFFQLLPALTLLENVVLPMDFCRIYPRAERKEHAMALLEMFGVAGHAHKLPSAVSGGEQQRSAIARAMATDPPLIMADEPTGNLDTRNANEVFHFFELLVEAGKTVVLVTHDPAIGQRTGRVVRLLDGEICQDEYHHGGLEVSAELSTAVAGGAGDQ